MPAIPADRRQYHRRALDQPVKLRCDRVPNRYLGGRTRNVSAGGALLELSYPIRLRAGDRLELWFAERAVALLREDARRAGVVVRATAAEAGQALAIAFDTSGESAAAGPSADATG